MNTPDRYAERLPAHLLQSEKHPSAPPAKFTTQCNFPSLLRGLLGEKKGKRKGREGKEGKKGKEREGRSGKGEERRKGESGRERGEKGGKRGREREREWRGASQMHGIQKKQLSKALAGMQICRISGPIIPWHTKHAGGINVPKRGLQNKQQIKKIKQHNNPMN